MEISKIIFDGGGTQFFFSNEASHVTNLTDLSTTIGFRLNCTQAWCAGSVFEFLFFCVVCLCLQVIGAKKKNTRGLWIDLKNDQNTHLSQLSSVK